MRTNDPTGPASAECPGNAALTVLAGLRPRRRGAALEEAIHAAVFDELAHSGFGALTIESVASRAKTGKASIYRRWPSKVDLVLDAFFARIDAATAATPMRELDDSVTTRDALVLFAETLSEFMTSIGEAFQAVGWEAKRDERLSSALHERLHRPRHDALVALLVRGQLRGEVVDGLNLDLVADVLPALLLHHSMLHSTPPTPAQVAELVDVAVLPLLSHAPAASLI